MTSQKRNDELVNLLRPDFFARNEPNASMVHYPGAILSTCGLQGFWPMSVIHNITPNIFAHDIATEHDLEFINGPTAGYLDSVTQTSLPPWVNFVAATSQYLDHGTDDSQHDITGTEAHVAANERGLTLGGWFKFMTVPASIFGLISKWYIAGPPNEGAYRLIKTAANTIQFDITTDGVTVVSATSTQVVTTATWYHLYGRFIPSHELAVFVDNEKTALAAGIPAAIFNSTEPLQIGRTSRANYLNGKASMCHLNAAQLSEGIIEVLWEQSRVMYSK